uniref:Uncharacterized protein n=1 Tax=Pipistrellus kuhlii TaxID=59472 RepID=A0A7J7XAX4_PIPKU|nr:hypothetical protein mPipKuh1_010598 [Pipistrellus kuhlii]
MDPQRGQPLLLTSGVSGQSYKLSRHCGSEGQGAAGFAPGMDPVKRKLTVYTPPLSTGPTPLPLHTQCVLLAPLSPAAVCLQPPVHLLYHMAGLPGAPHLQDDCSPALTVHNFKNHAGLIFVLL